ncbi:MAG: MaoC family dehydratase N-terminal domain-containing protein [Deltaproteobacteria bacterium]|nr:MaoC family dehydratase N-terminal domain-containing protein [Deltaproteobacteria bacterium]
MALNFEIIGKRSETYSFKYDYKDCAVYALGIGAQPDELDFLYEGVEGGMKVFPTFAVIPATQALFDAIGWVRADLTRLLHGEQGVVLYRTIPPSGEILTSWLVTHIHDKGKGALIVIKSESTTACGEKLFDNVFSIYVRGEGGFGGDKGPEPEKFEPAGRPPSFHVEYKTLETQALLYRLNGDANPLHAYPPFARMSGFEKPILHGLCTLGFASRAVLNSVCGGNPTGIKTITARFSNIVYPGDTIITDGWETGGGKYACMVSTQRGAPVITNFFVQT